MFFNWLRNFLRGKLDKANEETDQARAALTTSPASRGFFMSDPK